MKFILDCKKDFKRHWQLYVLLILPLTFLIVFNYIPIYGLQLAGAPSFISDLFNGAALILAVSLSVRAARKA